MAVQPERGWGSLPPPVEEAQLAQRSRRVRPSLNEPTGNRGTCLPTPSRSLIRRSHPSVSEVSACGGLGEIGIGP
jgi:hypothetical protein